MGWSDFARLSQRSAGPDGVAYLARNELTGELVELRALNGALRSPERWDAIRLRMRQLELLAHRHAWRPYVVDVENRPPYVAGPLLDRFPWTEIAGMTPGHRPAQTADSAAPLVAIDIVCQMVSALTAAHRLGLTHGRLCPSQVGRDADGRLQVDFTGLQVFDPRVDVMEVDRLCRAPEGPALADTQAADVYSLGVLLLWLFHKPRNLSRTISDKDNRRNLDAAFDLDRLDPNNPLDRLIRVLVTAEPGERPPAGVIQLELASLWPDRFPNDDLGRTSEHSSDDLKATLAPAPELNESTTLVKDQKDSSLLKSAILPPGAFLGRFQVLNKIGQGGMGTVYRATDRTTGGVVAIKTLHASLASRPESIKRFHKEARLLRAVNNPYVTNLLEVNEDRGVHYLALEFVPGKSLEHWIGKVGKLDEKTALRILVDLARATADAHDQGIIHRDIKPENVLIVDESNKMPDGDGEEGGFESLGGAGEFDPAKTVSRLPNVQETGAWSTPIATVRFPEQFTVKLTDFGLARHEIESASLNLTGAGAVVGTPLYMSPEQCMGTPVDCRSDIYSLGATLFHLLAGRPPFLASTPMAVFALHINEPAPAVKKWNPAVSDAASQIIEKCLEKNRESRYTNAGALLEDLERLLRGAPTGLVRHPRLPPHDPANVVEYDYTWELEATCEQLWKHVSNTERLNRAIGLPSVDYSVSVDEKKRVRRQASARRLGLEAVWEEHPFEWIEGRRMGVLREFSKGPFKWLLSIVDLAPRIKGGATLTHRFRVEPNGILGRTMAAMELGGRVRRALDTVYRRIDQAVTGRLAAGALADPFENEFQLPTQRRKRLEQLLDRLIEVGGDPNVVEQIGDFISLAPAQAVARIRPLAFAHRFALDPDVVVETFLRAAHVGLLQILWDIVCPICRIPSEIKETLRDLKSHGGCQACQNNFELDFANSVELIFRASAEIRDSELGVFCIGGPAHSPHVVAQVRVGAGERFLLDLQMPEGLYVLRGAQLPFTVEIRVAPDTALRRIELELSKTPANRLLKLGAGGQALLLNNGADTELVVRVERTASRDDALTAARAATLSLFRELFPQETLAPGQLVRVTHVTFVVTDAINGADLYQRRGDAQVFEMLHECFQIITAQVKQEGGAVIKTVAEGMLAAFTEPLSAVRAALALSEQLRQQPKAADLAIRIAVHGGAALSATVNGQLDYFGVAVRKTFALLESLGPHEAALSEEIASNTDIAAYLSSLDRPATLVQPTNQSAPAFLKIAPS